MGSDPLRAIVELATNADDAYEDGAGPRKGKIRIEIERHHKSETILRVMDRAKGMTPEEMEQRLTHEGARTSGFETGKDTRGLLGRGAKDIVHFGPAEWESLSRGRRSKFRLLYKNAATERWELDELDAVAPREHGTTVTLAVQPRFTVPRHEGLKRAPSRHFGLRKLLSDREHRDVTLVDVQQRREDHLVYARPTPKSVLEHGTVVEIPGYPGCRAKVALYEAADSLDDGVARDYWRHSLLISSGRSGYEIFDGGRFARDPWAVHLSALFGEADVPAINQLISEYDNRVENGLAPDTRNPIRLVKRDRSGLVPRSEHPFVDALYGALENVLEPHLQRMRAEAEGSNDNPVNGETRRRLNEVGKLLGHLLQEEAIDSGLEGGAGPLPATGLSVIPSVKVVDLGVPAYLLVRYRPPETDGPQTTVELLSQFATRTGSWLTPRSNCANRTATTAVAFGFHHEPMATSAR